MVSKFDGERGRRVISRWVESINDHQLNWAWAAVCGIVDVYAGLAMSRDVSFIDGQSQVWSDWFGVFEGGAGNIGVLGAYDEFIRSVPDDYHADLPRITGIAQECGKTGRALKRGEAKAIKTELIVVPVQREAPKTPSYLKLVVNNVEEA
jgi:hypothetical protein